MKKMPRKKKRSIDASETAVQVTPPSSIMSNVGVHLETVVLRSLAYREVGQPMTTGPNAPVPPRIAMNLELAGGLHLHERTGDQPGAVEFVISAKVRPEPAHKPIEIDVTITAVFTSGEGRSLGDVVRFVNAAGMRMIFPYLREIVSSVAARGICGPIFLDPVSVGALMPDAQVAELIARHQLDLK